MKIVDDGIGMPGDYDKQDSFGFVIIDSLVKQLKGTLSVRSEFMADDRGSEVILKIPIEG
jgi:two-component sensor histidine kinase